MQDKRAIYKVLPFVIEDESEGFLDKDSVYECYSYNSNFARCALSEENSEFFKAKKKQMMNLLYDKKCTSFYLQENPSMNEDEISSMSSTIYVDQEEKELYIFAKQFDNLDCQKIFEEIKERLELAESVEELKSYKPKFFFHSTLLIGDSETPTSLYFGKCDKSGRFEPLSPVYSLIDLGEGRTHLKVFLDHQSLTLYHYSLSENSLGIKLECKSKESKEIEEKEKQRKEKERAQKETLISTPSLSAFTPMIEDDTLMCIHGGQVKLQSQKGARFKSKGVPLILESDLANSSITGCANPPLLGGPCTKIALIPPLALSQKKFNGEGAPLQEYASMIMTDKGVPLMCIPKPNQFKVFQPTNPQGSEQSAKEIIASIKLERPKLRLHPKDNIFQKDNIPLYRIFNDGEEIKQEEAINTIELKLKDASHPIIDTLKKEYEKDYELKEAQVQIAFSLLRLVFIIPTKIPKIFKNSLKEYEDKDYGVGCFKLLDSFSSNIHNEDKGVIEYLRVLIAPAKLKKIDLEFAIGLDEKIAYKSHECGFVVIMGGKG